MTSETLSRTGSRVAAISRALIRVRDALSDGEPGQAGPGGESEVEGKRSGRSLVSMVLTSQAHRRCTPRTNRRIPAIPAGNIDGRLVHVSAVTPGRAGTSPGLLVAQPGASVTGPPPCPLPARGPVEGRPFEITDMAPPPDRRLRWGPVVMVRRRLCLESRLESVYSTRVGIYWPRVVRTARRPHLPAVPPTLVQ